jgi:hypothetical protein
MSESESQASENWDDNPQAGGESDTPSAAKGVPRRGRIRLGALIAIALAAAFVAWLLVRHNGNKSTSTSTTGTRTVALVSAQGIRTLAAAIRAPIYWAGPQPRRRYELTQTSDGRYYVRYLPLGVAAGSPTPYPFIATFPMSAAFAKTSKVAAQAGSVRLSLSNGVAFYAKSSPRNVYVAYRGSSSQIEVFDPNPARARQLVVQGRLEPVTQNGSAAATAPTAVPLAQLKALPRKVQHPVFWAGPRRGRTYELTQTSTGRIFIRYLPSGVQPGSTDPYLFVATFPLANAYAATKAVAARPDSVAIPVSGGGIAFYSSKTPTNVYLAFPNSDYQIEVFDPNAALAHAIVRANRITSLS